MKKHAILFGFIFAVLALASCKFEKGGTIEVKNDSNYKASIHIEDGSMMPVDGGAKQEAAAGKTVMFSISEDGAYTVEAVFYQTGFTGHGREKAVLSGGNKVTVQVKPSP